MQLNLNKWIPMGKRLKGKAQGFIIGKHSVWQLNPNQDAPPTCEVG
jgi:hypothetical protein